MAAKCPKCQSENTDTAQFCSNCASPLEPSKDIGVTKTIETSVEGLIRGALFADRYEIIEELGKGGMGKVYRALDTEVKEEVAVKLIKPEIAQDQVTIERFRNELKVARKVSHRNICRMHDLGKAEEGYFITMEYVDGEDLKSLIRKKGKLSIDEAIGVAQQVCEGLAEAHELGVIHRDMKPQNIMIDDKGKAKIMDFGIARSLEAPGVTATGMIIGTPDYISPEQAEGEEADQRSDIYSLGVILYEMITGGVPFKGDTAFSVALKHKSQLPVHPQKLNSEVSDDLARLILICMEKDRERRYQTAAELLADLKNIEEGFPLGTKIRPRQATFTQKLIRKKFFIPTLVVASVIIAIVIWQMLPKKATVTPLSDKPSLAVPYFENNTGDENLEYLRSGLSEWIIIDISQSKYINVLSGDKIFSILKKLNLLEADKLSSEDLEEIASQGRVDHILKGSFIKIGDNFIITAMLKKPQTGEVISSIKARCRGEDEIPQKVDELTKKIKADLNLTLSQIEGDIDREVGRITTGSPEAFKQYLEGWKHHIQFRYDESIEYMKKAIAEDSNFAMAYRTISWAYRWQGMFHEQRDSLKRAYELKDRASARERYLIEGDYYQIVEKNLDKAIDSYETLLEIYPNEMLGNFNLAQVYIEQLEEWDKAIPPLEVLVKNREEAIWIYTYLGNAYTAKGLYNKVEELYLFYLENFPEDMRIQAGLANNYIYLGEYDRALSEYEEVFSSTSNYLGLSIIKSMIELLRGNPDETEKELWTLLEHEEPINQMRGIIRLIPIYYLQGKFEKAEKYIKRADNLLKDLQDKELWRMKLYHETRGYIYLRTGRIQEALDEYNKMWDVAVEDEAIDYKIIALEGKGSAYLKLKELDRAHETADELKLLLEKQANKKLMRHYFRLVGKIAAERNNNPEAIDNLEKALSLVSVGPQDIPPGFIEPLALAYYRAGNLDRAREEFERITRITMGRINYGDIYAKSYYMLGKIHEQQGDSAKALEQYEKFLTLWKDADPGIAEVDDAKERLAELRE